MPLEGVDVLDQLALRSTGAPADPAPQPDWLEQWFPLANDVRFDDGVTLAEANALALYYSPRLRAARAREDISEALVIQAGVLKNPQLFLGPRLSLEEATSIVPASVYWQVPLWGQRSARKESALAGLDVSQLEVVDAELATLQAVRNGFLRLERRRSEEDAYAAAAAFSSDLVRWIEQLRAAGEADPAAVYLVRSERDGIHFALERARARRVAARIELLELVGLLPDAAVEFVTADARTMPSNEALDETQALLRVPALRRAHAEYDAAEAALKLAVRKQYPTVRLGLEYESDRGEVFLGPGLLLSLPLFDRNQGGIAAAERARGLARENYTAALLRASHRVARSRTRVDAAASSLEVYREGALREADSALTALKDRLRLGRATPLEAVATQSALARTRVQVLELEEQLYAARFELAVASGLALSPTTQPDPEELPQ